MLQKCMHCENLVCAIEIPTFLWSCISLISAKNCRAVLQFSSFLYRLLLELFCSRELDSSKPGNAFLTQSPCFPCSTIRSYSDKSRYVFATFNVPARNSSARFFESKNVTAKSILQSIVFRSGQSTRSFPLVALADPITTSNCCSREMLFPLWGHGRWHEGIPHAVW